MSWYPGGYSVILCTPYFMILICIRMIYSQICVNFRILGKNGDNMAKGKKYTKLKRESWNTSTLTKVAQIRKKPRCHQ